MQNILDLRGLSCPIPLIRTKQAMENNSAISVVVDEVVARENILKFAKSQGYTVSVKEDNDEYTLNIAKA